MDATWVHTANGERVEYLCRNHAAIRFFVHVFSLLITESFDLHGIFAFLFDPVWLQGRTGLLVLPLQW